MRCILSGERRTAIRLGGRRSSFFWQRAILSRHISFWVVTPFDTLAKLKRLVQPTRNNGEKLASQLTSTHQRICLHCESEPGVTAPSSAGITRPTLCLGIIVAGSYTPNLRNRI